MENFEINEKKNNNSKADKILKQILIILITQFLKQYRQKTLISVKVVFALELKKHSILFRKLGVKET